MSNFDQLADELMVKILNYLSYDDLILVKMVNNKRLINLVDYIINSNIVWSRSSKCGEKSIYKFLNELINPDNSLINCVFFNFQKNISTYQNIKKLALCDISILPRSTCFHNLIYLQIESNMCNESKLIKSPNLEFTIILLSKSLNENFKLVLDAIKLEMFRTTNDLNIFKILHTNSIKYLYCNSYDTSLIEFKNLEVLSINNFNNYLLTTEFIDQLINLKTFKFRYFDFTQSLNTIYNQLYLNSKNNLEIYFRCVRLNSVGQFDDLKNLNQLSIFNDNAFKIYKNFIDNLDKNLNFIQLNISNIDDLPVEIILKTKIYSLCINNNIKDDNKFIQILNICKPASIIINIRNTDKILNLIKKINYINIAYLKLNEINNIDLISNFRYLEKLECNKFFNVYFFKFLIKHFKYLRKIKINEYSIVINKNTIQFLIKDKISYESDKDKFFNYSINLMDSWSDVFNLFS